MEYNFMKMLAVASMISLGALSMVACQKTEPEIKIERDIQGTGIGEYKGDVEVTPTYDANAEYKQVTVNENGVKIYGKIVTAETASPVGKKVIEKKKIADKNIAKEGLSVTYSEYYSEAYGGTVILRTDNKDGSSEIYDENGERFISGEKVDIDMETLLQNYRISNAMADAMNEKYKKK